MKTRLSLLAAALLLAGCKTLTPSGPAAPPPPPPPPAAIDEFAWSQASGPNAIEGRGVWRDQGRRFTCAGHSVALMPETTYTRRRIAEIYGSNVHALHQVTEVKARSEAAGPGRDLSAYVRNVPCEADGRFVFAGLPDGAWYVIARGAAVAGGAGQGPMEGEVALRRVEKVGGGTAQVRLVD
jgi:hypothetical protein